MSQESGASGEFVSWINLHQRKTWTSHVVKSRRGNQRRWYDCSVDWDENTKILYSVCSAVHTGFLVKIYISWCRLHARRRTYIYGRWVFRLWEYWYNVQAMNIGLVVAGTNKGLREQLGAGNRLLHYRIVKDITGTSLCIIPKRYKPRCGFAGHNYQFDFSGNGTQCQTLFFESGNLSYNRINALTRDWADTGRESWTLMNMSGSWRCICESNWRFGITLQAEDKRIGRGGICVYYPSHADEEVISILRRHKIHCTMRCEGIFG